MERLRLDDAAYFIYTGQGDVPMDVIRVRIHSSVRVIRGRAFIGRLRLLSVEFHDGVEVIEKKAFYECRSLRKICIPPNIRAIKGEAFCGCTGLTTVNPVPVRVQHQRGNIPFLCVNLFHRGLLG